ncbi:hypothetical protein ACFLU6_04640, partial [Acidobacteriota bacterium]
MYFDKSEVRPRLSSAKYVALAKQLAENLGVAGTDQEFDFAVDATTMYFEGDGYIVDKLLLSSLVFAHLSALKAWASSNRCQIVRW